MAVLVKIATLRRSPKKSVLEIFISSEEKRLCHMQILLTVEEPEVSIENDLGGTLIELPANFQRINR